jgi:hypothetical protein
VGVDYIQFRKANPEFAGLSDTEISLDINEYFRAALQPQTANWNGYELTFYVNPGATDIRSIKPYAAYDLKYGEWTVHPDPTAHAPHHPEWESVVSSDKQQAHQSYIRYTQALNDLQVSHSGPARRNAEARLHGALQQGSALFDEIHENRSDAFSGSGEGYADFNNYRWQAGKREGTIELLRSMREYASSLETDQVSSTYGVELPDADTLVRRAALYGVRH